MKIELHIEGSTGTRFSVELRDDRNNGIHVARIEALNYKDAFGAFGNALARLFPGPYIPGSAIQPSQPRPWTGEWDVVFRRVSDVKAENIMEAIRNVEAKRRPGETVESVQAR